MAPLVTVLTEVAPTCGALALMTVASRVMAAPLLPLRTAQLGACIELGSAVLGGEGGEDRRTARLAESQMPAAGALHLPSSGGGIAHQALHPLAPPCCRQRLTHRWPPRSPRSVSARRHRLR